MPYKNKNEYNDYKRDYMREYRKKRRLPKASQNLQISEIPSSGDVYSNTNVVSHRQVSGDTGGNQGKVVKVNLKEKIFGSVERKEKVERLRTHFSFVTRGVGGGPFWTSSRREFNQKCDSLLKNLDTLEPEEVDELVESLKNEAREFEFLLQVPSWTLDRLAGKLERDIMLGALADLQKTNPGRFSNLCSDFSGRSAIDEILSSEILFRTTKPVQ